MSSRSHTDAVSRDQNCVARVTHNRHFMPNLPLIFGDPRPRSIVIMATVSWSRRCNDPATSSHPKEAVTTALGKHARQKSKPAKGNPQPGTAGPAVRSTLAKSLEASSQQDLGAYNRHHVVRPSDHAHSTRGIPVRPKRCEYLSNQLPRVALSKEKPPIPSCLKALKRDLTQSKLEALMQLWDIHYCRSARRLPSTPQPGMPFQPNFFLQ